MQLRFVKSESTFTYFEAYLIEENELSRRAIGKYIEVRHYPDDGKELRLNGVVLPYSTYDRLQERYKEMTWI